MLNIPQENRKVILVNFLNRLNNIIDCDVIHEAKEEIEKADNSVDLTNNELLIDIGSGAGFPGFGMLRVIREQFSVILGSLTEVTELLVTSRQAEQSPSRAIGRSHIARIPVVLGSLFVLAQGFVTVSQPLPYEALEFRNVVATIQEFAENFDGPGNLALMIVDISKQDPAHLRGTAPPILLREAPEQFDGLFWVLCSTLLVLFRQSGSQQLLCFSKQGHCLLFPGPGIHRPCRDEDGQGEQAPQDPERLLFVLDGELEDPVPQGNEFVGLFDFLASDLLGYHETGPSLSVRSERTRLLLTRPARTLTILENAPVNPGSPRGLPVPQTAPNP